MSIIKMKKVSVIGMDTVKEELLSSLMKLGVVQVTNRANNTADDTWINIVDKDGDDETVSVLEAYINKISIAIETLNKYSNKKSPLFITRKEMVDKDFYDKAKEQGDIEKNVEEVLSYNDQLHQYMEQINKKKADFTSILPWKDYDLPLEIEGTQKTTLLLGVIPSAADISQILNQVEEVTGKTYIKEISRDRDLIYVAGLCLRDEEESVLEILKQHGFTQTPFKGMAGTPSKLAVDLKEEIGNLQQSCEEVKNKIGKIDYMVDGIKWLYDIKCIERDKSKVKENLLKTSRTFYLEGWVPATCEEKTEKLLKDKGCSYEFREPLDDEEVPVLTVNDSFVQPFEAITDMYSLPDYRGVDPTKYFALFYAMFFGIMLSDAGYGIVIALACFVVLRKFKLEGMTYKMIKMFFYCGIATVFWGALFGGWFGDIISVVSKTFFGKEVILKPLWFNPIEDPIKLLIFSLILGVIHLFVGMGIKAVMLIKRGQLLDAVCDIFSWYLVIVGAAMWLGGSSISEGLVKPGMYIAIAGAAIILLTGGRNNKGIGKVTGGLSSLYNITSYLSDILSYARLLALGLATGVIAQVVNMMGALNGDGVIGVLIFVVIGLIGHVFNLAINALGAFVHSSRLQYIEFFGKFYEDGGEEFKPFMRNTKYIRLMKDINGGRK